MVSWLFLIILSTLCEEENLTYYSYLHILFAYPTLYFLLYHIFTNQIRKASSFRGRYITSSIIKKSTKMPLQYACSISIINSYEIEDYEAERNKLILKNIKAEKTSLSEKIIINKNNQPSRKINSRL